MSVPTKQSRWGSFLQQAVAGVEAKLDTILTDNENGVGTEAVSAGTAAGLSNVVTATAETKSSSASLSSEVSPTTPTQRKQSARGQEQLQVRLARAIAVRAAAASVAPTTVSGSESRAAEDNDEHASVEFNKTRMAPIDDPTAQGVSDLASRSFAAGLVAEETPVRADDHVRDDTGQNTASNVGVSVSDATSSQVASDMVASDHDKEIQGYVEQIDSLRAKVLYLAAQLGAAARDRIDASAPSSLERKLAERDKQYSLLMKEGQELSSKEQKHIATIRRLVAQNRSDTAFIKVLTDNLDATRDELAAARVAESQVHELEQRLEESNATVQSLNERVLSLQREAQASRATIQSLQQRDLQVSGFSDSDAISATAKPRIDDLEHKLAAMQASSRISSQEAHDHIAMLESELKASEANMRKLAQDREREVKSLESKLEVARLRAEDASSRSAGDSQLALVRQLETIQSQYATASKNWEGIESSLLARVSNLEQERDQALRVQVEMRKKARDSASHLKEEIATLRETLKRQQRELEDQKREIEQLLANSRPEQSQDHTDANYGAVSLLRDVREPSLLARSSWGVDRSDRGNEGGQPWDNAPSRNPGYSGSTSPMPQHVKRTLSPDMLMLHSLTDSRHAGVSAFISDGLTGSRIGSRRASTIPPFLRSMTGDDDDRLSNVLDHIPDQFSGNRCVSPVATDDREAPPSGMKFSLSSHHPGHDMTSVSNSAAGPSVQLVERMSAAIRRLEAEKLSSRDELSRVSNQRDEARSEITALMKDLSEQRAASQRIVDLEHEISVLQERYQATLELLGEKSELVEELQADIHDLKEMYRELVERAVTS